jgi:hypothetical protein
MGTSTHVVGIKPPDATWHKMNAALQACRAANVPIPPEIDKYFDGEEPDPDGVIVDISYHEYEGDMEEGYQVNIEELPAHVKIIRFYNSY